MPGEYPPRDADGSRLRRTETRADRSDQSRPGAPRWQAPTARPGASGSQRRQSFAPGRADSADVYRPYSSAGRSAGPRHMPGAATQGSADPFAASGAGMMTSAHMEAVQRKHRGFALFHDGNAGHLWRGEIFSLLGEGALSIGVIIWIVTLTASPYAVLAAVVALGLPWLLIGPLGATLENAREPGRLLAWIGRVRVIAALGIVAMHFVTIYPVLYLLLLLIGVSGRLRQSLRVAAMRVCLAPGETELVTNDLYIGAAVAAVVGPLLGSLFFLLLGDRIILVGLAAALLFLLAGNSDGFLDALPEAQRGFLQATVAVVAPDDATRDDLLSAVRDGAVSPSDASDEDDSAEDEDDSAEDATQTLSQEQRELSLPEWYQQGPQHVAQALGDIRAGLALAGGRSASASGLLALLALALVGGGLSTLEVFFLSDRLNLAPIYLGALVGLEGAGLALGALLAGMPPFSKMGPRLTLVGLALTGVALAIFGVAPRAYIVFLAALGMGAANALAVMGARQALRAGRDGAERRAVSAAEGFLTALMSLLGAVLFTAAYVGVSGARLSARLVTHSLPIGALFTIAGGGLALLALALLIWPGLRDRQPRQDEQLAASVAPNTRLTGLAATATAGPSASIVGALWDGEQGDEDEDDGPASRYSSAYPAAGDDDARGYTGSYDADGYDDYERDTDGYDDEYDDGYGDEPPTRGGPRRPPSGRQPPRRDHRSRW